MEALDEFDVTLTFCFTPEHRGIEAHHSSAPLVPQEFADFCAEMLRRYYRPENGAAYARSASAHHIAAARYRAPAHRHIPPLCRLLLPLDRTSVESGKRVSVSVDLGVRSL